MRERVFLWFTVLEAGTSKIIVLESVWLLASFMSYKDDHMLSWDSLLIKPLMLL